MASSYKHTFRFYGQYDPHATSQDSAWSVSKEERHHMTHVVKLRRNAEAELCDGLGHVAQIRITASHKRQIHWQVLDSYKEPRAVPAITLCIASDILQDLPRLLPPLTELGLNQLHWISSAPTSSQALSEKLSQRITRIAISAIKQSKSPYFVRLAPYPSLNCALQQHHACSRWVLDPTASCSLTAALWEYKQQWPLAQHASCSTSQQPSLPSSSSSSAPPSSFPGPVPSPGPHTPLVLYMGGASGFATKDHHLLHAIPHAHLGPYIMRVTTAAQCIVAITRGIFSSTSPSIPPLSAAHSAPPTPS